MPYTTRVLVRRPINAHKQSGTVVVEPLNPSNRFDLNIGWGFAHDQFMRNGDVWIGFTSKPIAIQALKTFDPQRYAAAVMGEPAELDDPRNCTSTRFRSSTRRRSARGRPRTGWCGTSSARSAPG